MRTPLGGYSFLPWVREGLGTSIAGAAGQRATIPAGLTVRGTALDGSPKLAQVQRKVELYGPGDVVGIDSRAIIRVEPQPWIANFEPNYLPFVEFYDEDFPWRYTPAAAAGDRLIPWLVLAVLAEGEFEEVREVAGPLAAITIAAPGAVLPPPEQLWAWAHVHVNRSLAAPVVASDGAAVAGALAATVRENPDLAYARLLSPRRLVTEQSYHAFLLPTLESGRLAGLGADPGGAAQADTVAWTAAEAAAKLFPVYHRWQFRTGTVGDFEYLVRLLRPRPADARVGRRPMDVRDPGAGVPPLTELGGVLQLGGALRVPAESLSADERAEVARQEAWDEPYPRPLQEGVAALLNLGDDYVDPDSNEPAGPDPLVLPPLYGRWPALVQRVLTRRDGSAMPNRRDWVHELNLDPRFRVASGFGTRVVQQYQEDYMAAAWAQVGDVLVANRTIRLAQAGREVSGRWHARTLAAMRDERPGQVLALTAPVHGRVVADGTTLAHAIAVSNVPGAAVSPAMRRIVRPRGRLVRALPFGRYDRPDELVEKVADGSVSAAPAREVPARLPTVDDLGAALLPAGLPGWIVTLLRRAPWIVWALLLLALLLIVLLLVLGAATALLVLGAIVVVVLVAAIVRLLSWRAAIAKADVLRQDERTREAVDRLPQSPDFELTEPGSEPRPTTGATDGEQARRFKAALADAFDLLDASGAVSRVVPQPPLAVAATAAEAVDGLDPQVTIARRLAGAVRIPPHIAAVQAEEMQEVMAYPVIDLPMYKPLVDVSTELFLPNLNLVANDSITLLQTNQRFIESYLVGVNHEFARELLWREYPCDQRGTTFRQFWDVSSYLAAEPDAPALRERLRDIPPLHLWRRGSALGDHDHREASGSKDEEVVLVIRGELLKRYPNAVVYAHRADWARDDGQIVRDRPRFMVDATEQDGIPVQADVRTPLYTAPVMPDVYFFGFDLTVEEATGGTGEHDDDPAGWFFVIKERPGEPRFGLDVDSAASIDELSLWDELAWEHVVPAPTGAPQFLRIDRTVTLRVAAGPPDPAVTAQHQEDSQVAWSASTNSAELAYVLYQMPVLVGVHAAEMLRERP